jgi:hypothetical protein
MKMDPGKPFDPTPEASRGPVSNLKWYPLFSPCLANMWGPLARPHHLLLPWTTNLAENRPSSPLTPPFNSLYCLARFFPEPQL